jgi:hypothetical protein
MSCWQSLPSIEIGFVGGLMAMKKIMEAIKDFLFVRRCTHCGESPVKTTAVSWYYDAWSPAVNFPVNSIHSSHLCEACLPGVFDRYMGMDRLRPLIEEAKKAGLIKEVQ